MDGAGGSIVVKENEMLRRTVGESLSISSDLARMSIVLRIGWRKSMQA